MTKVEIESKLNKLIEQCNSMKLKSIENLGNIKQVNDENFPLWKSDVIFLLSKLKPDEIIKNISDLLNGLEGGWNVERDLKSISAYLKTIQSNLNEYLQEKKTPVVIPKTDLLEACKIIADTNNGLTGKEIVEYSNAYAEDFNVDIPVYSYPFNENVSNKKEALLKNLEKFSNLQQLYIIVKLCDYLSIKGNKDIQKLKDYITGKYGEPKLLDYSNEKIIVSQNDFLSKYAKSYNLMNKSIVSVNTESIDRSTLDNARLALELLLREILRNDKSLENQNECIGIFLKDKNISNEVRNMFIKLLDYYSKYQNEYIKHNDEVNTLEVKYILDLTYAMMALLVKLKESN